MKKQARKVAQKVSKQVSKKVTKTRNTVEQVLSQAKDSLKLLETLERDTVERAKNFVKMPTINTDPNAWLVTERVQSSLRRLGFATRDEVRELQERIERLEAALADRSLTAKEESASTLPQA